MAFFSSAVTVLQTLVVALGAGLGIWGVINLLEGYGNDNPGAKEKGLFPIKIPNRHGTALKSLENKTGSYPHFEDNCLFAFHHMHTGKRGSNSGESHSPITFPSFSCASRLVLSKAWA